MHYGTFPGSVDAATGQLETVYVMVRSHNWHPTDAKEQMIELDAESGKEVRRVVVPSRFTHDVVRMGDKVFACNTDGGQVLQLSFPSLEVVSSSQTRGPASR